LSKSDRALLLPSIPQYHAHPLLKPGAGAPQIGKITLPLAMCSLRRLPVEAFGKLATLRYSNL
jgi:hypothetical protein